MLYTYHNINIIVHIVCFLQFVNSTDHVYNELSQTFKFDIYL